MKNSMILAISMMFAVVGFSQSVQQNSGSVSKAHCDKGKPACCAHGAVKSCGESSKDAKSRKKASLKSSATESKRNKRSEARTSVAN